MTSVSGDLILPDNRRIINRSGKVFGSDNISYLTYTIDVHILTNQNDTVPIATTTTSDSTGKAGITRLFAPSGSGTPLNLRIRSNTTLTGMTSTGAIEVSIQPVTYSTDTSV
ncbi:hypothetical protein ACTFIW_011221 [Dictyostelium discoideum]